MSDEIEDALDELLREQFAGPVADGGFSLSVMEQLPARRRRKDWPLAIGTLGGVATCWLSLRSSPIAYAGWQDWLSGDLSASAGALLVAIASMAVLAMAWSIAETDDRRSSWPRQTIR
ncbi:DUF5056 domain-containing protein [Altererythrobacter sp. BO-6]|uniref:DUF5056 domain-containing protein n=1 Tax=Altererythrobacter sp. BO-6 TaxID=2604537 RepID=UPI0013E129A9|nr:DUF5056 domain-containing protein [Altererythrobacter sp. BO-6]QIG53728.1 DUF5056 domain-containing protein [Altererythrobacter sp. BO-6]